MHNGSSLFTGDAGQGESNIRRWIIENDWLEAIVALPLNMFYNTGIATYIWVLTNRKPEHRKGKVQLIDATQWFKPLRKNLGKKNCELSDEDIQRICDTFLTFEETEQSKIFPNAAFGYWKVTVERPLRLKGIDPERAYSPKEIKALKETARAHGRRAAGHQEDPQEGHGGRSAPRPVRGHDRRQARRRRVRARPDLRDTEQVPLLEEGGIEAFLRREVLPHAADAWYVPGQRQDRLRDQLHPLLLQAAAAADAGGDPRRHPGAGEGDRGAARRDHWWRPGMTLKAGEQILKTRDDHASVRFERDPAAAEPNKPFRLRPALLLGQERRGVWSREAPATHRALVNRSWSSRSIWRC